MVHIIQPNECNHDSCDGESKPGLDHYGELMFGGYFCLCNCHDTRRQAEAMERAAAAWEEW